MKPIIYMPGEEHIGRSSGSGMSKGCIGVIEADIEEVATGPGVVEGELHEGRNIETHELHAVCMHEACMVKRGR